MADLNLVDFYHDTAKILVHLHSTFPRKIELYVEDIIGPDEVDEFGLHSKRHESCLGAMFWLADENYLRYYTTIRQEAIDQVILTSKALTLLGTVTTEIETLNLDTTLNDTDLPPSELKERNTFIGHIRRALRSESTVQLTQVMRTFLELGHHR